MKPRQTTETTDARAPARPKVLVADDNQAMRQLIVRALRNDGYEVEEARNGGELLRHLADHALSIEKEYDLIVSDHRMPVSNGLDIACSLLAGGWEIPVILMTAFGDPALHEAAAEIGVKVFDKPFEMLDLRTAVRMMLSAPRAPRAPGAPGGDR